MHFKNDHVRYCSPCSIATLDSLQCKRVNLDDLRHVVVTASHIHLTRKGSGVIYKSIPLENIYKIKSYANWHDHGYPIVIRVDLENGLY